ncbi:MAG: hypothetical protein ACLS6G_13190 [Christensenellales bacterium]
MAYLFGMILPPMAVWPSSPSFATAFQSNLTGGGGHARHPCGSGADHDHAVIGMVGSAFRFRRAMR